VVAVAAIGFFNISGNGDMINLYDRVKQVTSTSGTGTITLSSSIPSFEIFSSVLSDGQKTYYAIQNGIQWEVGIGTYSGNTLARQPIDSNSGTSTLIDIYQTSNVFITYPASKSVIVDDNSIVSGSYTGILLPDGNVQTIAFTGQLQETVSNASGLTSAVTIELSNQVTGSATFTNAGDTASINTFLTAASISGQTAASSIAASDNFILERGAAIRKVRRDILVTGLSTQAEVSLVSGYLQGQITTNVNEILNNDSNISDLQTATGLLDTDVQELQTATGLLDARVTTNTNNITLNDSDISELQTATGLLDTDVQELQTATGLLDADVQELQTATGLLNTSVAANTAAILTNDSKIFDLETATGLLDADVQTLSGLVYEPWILNVSGSNDAITSSQTVTFTGIGTSFVSYNEITNTVTISGSPHDGSGGGGGGGGYDWNVSVTGASETIASGDTVAFTGLGNNSVFYDFSTNTVSISGDITTVSGYLQGQITTNQNEILNNDSNISDLQTATGLLDTDVQALQTATGLLDSDVQALQTATGLLDSDVQALQTATGLLDADVQALQTATGLLDADVQELQTATGLLNADVAANTAAILTNDSKIFDLETATGLLDADVQTLSGLVYEPWSINVTGNIDAIASSETVLFTGTIENTILYSSASNTVRVDATSNLRTINFSVDGGGSVISTGVKRYSCRSPYAGNITGWEIAGGETGIVTFDIWKTDYSTVPQVGNSIVGSDYPKSTGLQFTSSTDTSLSGWDRAFNSGDIFAIVINNDLENFTQIDFCIKYKEVSPGATGWLPV